MRHYRYTLSKGLDSQSCVFSSSHVWMWVLDHKECWALENRFFWTVLLVKTLESPLDSEEIKPVSPERKQPWIFIGRTDTKAKAPILWSPDAKNWLVGKDPDAGKDWGQEEKGTTEDEMVGWHQRLNGHEFEQTPGDSEGQGSLACCSPWVHRVGHNWATEWWRTAIVIYKNIYLERLKPLEFPLLSDKGVPKEFGISWLK